MDTRLPSEFMFLFSYSLRASDQRAGKGTKIQLLASAKFSSCLLYVMMKRGKMQGAEPQRWCLCTFRLGRVPPLPSPKRPGVQQLPVGLLCTSCLQRRKPEAGGNDGPPARLAACVYITAFLIARERVGRNEEMGPNKHLLTDAYTSTECKDAAETNEAVYAFLFGCIDQHTRQYIALCLLLLYI